MRRASCLELGLMFFISGWKIYRKQASEHLHLDLNQRPDDLRAAAADFLQLQTQRAASSCSDQTNNQLGEGVCWPQISALIMIDLQLQNCH